MQVKSKLENAEVEKKLAITEATQKVEKERDDLANIVKIKDTEKQLLEKSINEKYQAELKEKDAIIKHKDEEIALRKDMKLKLSTKMIGETLEQHCETEFNKLRATAFQRAYFEKDNDSKTGSKGNFIFKETDEAGNEIITQMKVKLNIFIFFNALVLLTSCNGQSSNKPVKTENIVKGNSVSVLDNKVMVIFQDSKKNYWFGSWETGVYKYDGKTIVNYTTKNGLLNNRIDEIKEDELGNIYFSSANATSEISKFNGKIFTTLKAIHSENWKLDSTDLWFKYSYGNTGKVYRYDGTTLFELQLPNPPNLSNPFAVYSIYKDIEENIWFGTNPVGVCRYDGKSFQWITEEDVTEFRNEGANGVRSITEDKNGDFWFNAEYRYSVYDGTTLKSNKFYTRHKSIGGLDGKKDSNLDEYLSTVRDNNNNLWFVTYLDGVWKYDGMKITHYPIQEKSKQIALVSIYKDNNGELWIGTHENGANKFNGTTFEKFIK